MTPSSNDEMLRTRFHELREQVSESAPAFSVGSGRSVGRAVSRWVLVSGGMASVAAAALLVMLWPRSRPGPGVGPDLSTVVWVAPTDYLLDTPGRDLLNTVPLLDPTGFMRGPVGTERATDDTSS